MSQVIHSPSRLRRLSQWVASKPETTAWVALCVTVIAVVELADHVLHWW